MRCTVASARTVPPASSEGWTIHFIERSSRYWVSAMAGYKDELLFQRGTQQAWQWAQACAYIRWFTDGERRYAKALWDLASVYLALRNCPSAYRTRKAWRDGLEVAMKIKGSQGQRRVVWIKTEHPFTASLRQDSGRVAARLRCPADHPQLG